MDMSMSTSGKIVSGWRRQRKGEEGEGEGPTGLWKYTGFPGIRLS